MEFFSTDIWPSGEPAAPMRRGSDNHCPALGDDRSRDPLFRGSSGRGPIFRRASFGVLAVQFLREANSVHDTPDDQIEMPLAETSQNPSHLGTLRRMAECEEQNAQHEKQNCPGIMTHAPACRPILGIVSGDVRVMTCVVGHGRFVERTRNLCQEENLVHPAVPLDCSVDPMPRRIRYSWKSLRNPQCRP